MSEAFDFGKKKKKKTSTKKKEEEDAAEEQAEVQQEQPNDQDKEDQQVEKEEKEEVVGDKKEAKPDDEKSTEGDYSYEELAKRIFNLISASRPEEKTVYKMKPPVVYREGTSKTVWVNFPEICKIMNRAADHVLSFTLAEVGSTGSIDGSGRLVIKGKFQPKHIENILRNYIAEYVKCRTCKSPETYLKKENRLLFMVCEKCGSTRSVTAIKSGFQATTRAQRRSEKNKA